ncbi:voltage-dependent anion channel [Epithele typhae]|uniref:voltage-dependent anion channel n=1 Tax=Epithele typhae TaxID=378194 RepID=UPI00200886DE|nr:voltage-dependent anion channel [Epithele typhae]KAH9931134.1 voltage-dependent anion channel [Epithele typhae]
MSVPHKSLKQCARHFTPAWFAAIMGTGAISILFHSFPYGQGSQALQIFTYIFFFLNLALFIIFNAFSIARYIIFPDVWSLMINHPAQSLFLGTYPMGAATLINVAVGLIYEDYGFGGKPFLYALWAFWWLDVIISLFCAFVVVHVMKARQKHALDKMTSIWLLPVVTLIVASSSGGVIAPAMAEINPSYALLTLTVSASLVFIGLGLAFMILTTYLLRLILYGVPAGPGVLSVFIPLGPMGQGGFSILLLGQGFRTALPLAYGDSPVLRLVAIGEIVDVVALCVGMVLWALATMWLIYALLALYEVLRNTRFPFKQAFWGIIFPNGVYANLTVQLSRTLDSQFFRIWGAIYSVATLVLWVAVFTRTATLVPHGAIFESPCVDEYDLQRAAALAEKEKQASQASGASTPV